MSKEFENKKKYLLKRIKEEDNFYYSAPEVVDECFEFLKRIIDLNENFNKTNETSHKLGVNMYGDPIRCYVCDSLDHVQKDCVRTN